MKLHLYHIWFFILKSQIQAYFGLTFKEAAPELKKIGEYYVFDFDDCMRIYVKTFVILGQSSKFYLKNLFLKFFGGTSVFNSL